MSELSPSAQAVLDAAYRRMDENPHNEVGATLAAALRAAANHCHSQEIREADHTIRRWVCVDDLLAIADELEAQ
jgi:hypothetical protein